MTLELIFIPFQLKNFLLLYPESFYWGAVEVQLTQQATLYILLSVRLLWRDWQGTPQH